MDSNYSREYYEIRSELFDSPWAFDRFCSEVPDLDSFIACWEANGCSHEAIIKKFRFVVSLKDAEAELIMLRTLNKKRANVWRLPSIDEIRKFAPCERIASILRIQDKVIEYKDEIRENLLDEGYYHADIDRYISEWTAQDDGSRSN